MNDLMFFEMVLEMALKPLMIIAGIMAVATIFKIVLMSFERDTQTKVYAQTYIKQSNLCDYCGSPIQARPIKCTSCLGINK